MSRAIFISHAADDADLVRVFVDFLIEGVGVGEDDIFCSSLEGMGIPTGKNFVSYVKGEIEAPEVVIMMITPSYKASLFCIAEMGAAWVKGHEVFPIIVPPASYEDMKAVMLGTQAMMINDEIRVNELREKLITATGCNSKSPIRWDLKRKGFYEALPLLTSSLSKPVEIEPAKHEELQARYSEALDEIETSEKRIIELGEKLEALKKLKDSADITAALSQFADDSVTDQFDDLVSDVKMTLNEMGTDAVRRKILAEYYSQPIDISYADQEDFNRAIRRKILDEDGDLIHRHTSVKELDKLLTSLRTLIDEHGDELQPYADAKFSAPLETDSEEFWEEHLL